MADIGYLKRREVEFIKWNGDNFAEVKRFCRESCSVTYEIANGIDEYWSVKVYDFLLNEMTVASVGSYIVKLSDDDFIVVGPTEFSEYFEFFVAADVDKKD